MVESMTVPPSILRHKKISGKLQTSHKIISEIDECYVFCNIGLITVSN